MMLVSSSAVAQWIELRTLNYDNPVGILCCRVKPWAGVFTIHCSSSLSCMNVYMTIDSGGYLCANSLRALIAEWLDVSPRSRDGV